MTEQLSGSIVVAVYGTLKRGQSNHHFLGDQQCLGRCLMKDITLYDLGPYPAAKLGPSEGVEVEVYAVNETVFGKLDWLEDYDAEAPARGLYDRVRVETPFGEAWVYIYNEDVAGCRVIRAGGWSPAN